MSTSDHVKIIRAARDAAMKLGHTEQDLRARHTALVQERQRAWGALEPRGAVHANARRLVEAARDHWRAHHAEMWTRALSARREIRGVHDEREVRVPPRLPDLAGPEFTFAALCGLVPDAIIASIDAMIDAQPDSRFGLPHAERDRRLAELDEQIADLERQHAALTDAATEVGLTLAHLPTVAERRQAEAEEAERERLLVEARARAATADVEPQSNPWAVR